MTFDYEVLFEKKKNNKGKIEVMTFGIWMCKKMWWKEVEKISSTKGVKIFCENF